jgi:hypothetical protein
MPYSVGIEHLSGAENTTSSMSPSEAQAYRTREFGGKSVKSIGTLAMMLGLALCLPATARAAEQQAQAADQGAKPVKCLEAAVNPVTGFAVCVNPVGAPVDPPPAAAFQPCKPRTHDNDVWTMYESIGRAAATRTRSSVEEGSNHMRAYSLR